MREFNYVIVCCVLSIFVYIQPSHAEIVQLNTENGKCYFQCSSEIEPGSCPDGWNYASQDCWIMDFDGNTQQCGDIAQDVCGTGNVVDWNYTQGFYEDVKQIKTPDGKIVYKKKEERK